MAIDEKQLCPWCGSEVSRAKFLAIEAKIREEEKKRFAATEASLRAEFSRKQATEIAAAKAAGQKEALAASATTVRAANAQCTALEARIKQAESIQKKLQQEQESKIAVETAKVRQTLAREQELSLLRKSNEFTRERETWQKKIKLLEVQLQKKTSNEIGDGGEVDLYETLRNDFPDDKITRVPKGTNGADIVHQVMHKGRSCGSIIIDCKHRQSWQNAYITKLRQDQIEAKAEHAILSSSVFPSGSKELCVLSGVIVVAPGRTTHIIEVLRKALVSMHLRGLAVAERSTKTDLLYKFITSDAYMQRFQESQALTETILEVDVDEKREHDKVWKKRGALARRLTGLLREIDTDISAIIDGNTQAAVASKKNPASIGYPNSVEGAYGTK